MVRIGFFVLPNDLPETFRGAQTCRSIIMLYGDAWISIVQNGAAEIGVLTTIYGGCRCGRRAKQMRTDLHTDCRKRGRSNQGGNVFFRYAPAVP